MSLRDEHLQQALKNAPDKDVAPSDVVRQKVLDYAENAVNPKRSSFFKHGLKFFHDWRISSWQLVGMSTIASILFVTVLLRDQLAEETLWLDDEQALAQTNAEPAATNKLQQDALSPKKEAFADAVIHDEGLSLPEPVAEREIVNRVEDKVAKAKKSVPLETNVPKPIAKEVERPAIGLAEKKDTVAALTRSDAPMGVAVEERADMVERAVSADAETMEAAVESERPRTAAKARMAARKQVLPMAKEVSGTALAKKDIQVGTLRILYAESDWPESKPLFDAETGYRIEMVESIVVNLPVEELDAYNETMRNWYHTNENLAD